MKNDGDPYHFTTSVCHRAGTGQATLEVTGSKWIYALNWYKLINADDGTDSVDLCRCSESNFNWLASSLS